jgi:outer membrane protein assembly factor BamB
MTMNTMLKPLVLPCCMALALLTACSSNPKPEKHEPSPLPKLAQIQKLQPVFKASIASSEKHDPLRLQLDATSEAIYAVSRKGYVNAYSLNGKKIWEKRVAKKEREISSGVTVGGGLVIVGSASGTLYALDAATGEAKWQRQLSGSVLAPSLIHADRVVTFSNDGTVYGTDLNSGQAVWTFDVPSTALSVRGTAAPVMADEETVVLASASGYVFGLDVSSGVPKWQRRVAISEGRSEVQRLIDIDGDPVFDNGQMFTVSYQGQITAVDLLSQRVMWSQDSSSLRGLTVANGLVYVATTDGKVQAYNQRTGEPAWAQDALAYRELSNPVTIGQYLVVGDADGYLHLLDPMTGTIQGRVKSSGEVRQIRAIDNRLYVDTRTGHLSVWQAS